ncbi:MAG TPA: single-stranded DNA-binding protein [Limnochordia bacterium]
MLNRIVLIGRLVADPQLRYTPSGIPVTNFTLAVNRGFTNQQGEQETDFIDTVCWRKLAETVANHLTKGRLVAVEGRLQIRSYDASDGTRRKAAEVVADNVRFLDSPRDAGRAPEAAGDVPTDADALSTDEVPF